MREVLSLLACAAFISKDACKEETTITVCANFEEPLHILLVEDNPADVRLRQELLKEVPIPTSLSVVNDGEQAMAFLRREGQYAGAPSPDFILLDLRLPRKDGYEV